MNKKENEITVRDRENGVELLVGTHIIGMILEEGEKYAAYTAEDRLIGAFKTYPAAEEEIIKAYNLYL